MDGLGSGVVPTGTATDLVLALDDETGDGQWTYDASSREEYGDGPPGQPPVVVGISHSRQTDADPGDSTHRVVGLDRETGTERWATAVDGRVRSGPTPNRRRGRRRHRRRRGDRARASSASTRGRPWPSGTFPER